MTLSYINIILHINRVFKKKIIIFYHCSYFLIFKKRNSLNIVNYCIIYLWIKRFLLYHNNVMYIYLYIIILKKK